MIEKRFSITAEEQQQLQDTITTIQSSSTRPPEDTKQCITQLLQQYTAESQPGAELLLTFNIINKNITNNPEEQALFKSDIHYITSLIGDIKSSKKYKTLQASQEKQQIDLQASQEKQQIDLQASQEKQQIDLQTSQEKQTYIKELKDNIEERRKNFSNTL